MLRCPPPASPRNQQLSPGFHAGEHLSSAPRPPSPPPPKPRWPGIVFIDEIDKIVTSSEHRYGGDASAEGVQRDLLPIIEGEAVGGMRGCGCRGSALSPQGCSLF
jgi:hypothetical protein